MWKSALSSSACLWNASSRAANSPSVSSLRVPRFRGRCSGTPTKSVPGHIPSISGSPHGVRGGVHALFGDEAVFAVDCAEPFAAPAGLCAAVLTTSSDATATAPPSARTTLRNRIAIDRPFSLPTFTFYLYFYLLPFTFCL